MNKQVSALIAKTLAALIGVKGYFAKFVFEKVVLALAQAIVYLISLDQAEKKKAADKIKEEKRNENLKDGVTEDAQKGSTTDLLNG